VQSIEGEDGVLTDAEFGKQRLCRGDLIGFCIDIEVRQHELGVGGKSAEHVSGGSIVELVEAAAQSLAVQRDAAGTGPGVRRVQQPRVPTKDRLHSDRIEPLEDVADRGMRRCAAPFQTKAAVEGAAMGVDERDDTAIGIAAAHDREDRKQKHVGQLVEFALRAALVRHISQDVEQRGERGHGNLRIGYLPTNPRSIASGIRKMPAVSLSDVLLHIGLSEPSVQRVEQPWLSG